ncbi:DUF2357 domain-containing protein [Metabacillus bambusae]|uniref:DUF2357 domain-containing protein n=1 Tax=Metabacillus bambusae TaxID=2795218 RepID=A0ABS3MYM9_9BACI|nr:DUF2357 domain-containing protein [Metabacillus bambusae]MBO1511127.1 DUF2357 domain-containing protein [Metabacillus bambusae]
MAPLNSGVKITVWDDNQKNWVSLNKIYLEEAKIYRWRTRSKESFQFRMQHLSLPMTKSQDGWEGVFETPFQSGITSFTITTKEAEEKIENYVYTDHRKLTEQQYQLLLDELLKEASICFQQSGLDTNISASGYTRECSMLQWMYIESSIYKLRNTFQKILAHPLRNLHKEEVLMRRERVKSVTPRSIAWMERYGESFGGTPKKLPSHIQTTKVEETFNVYENRVILLQLNELGSLLKTYTLINDVDIQKKATQYLDWISLWKKAEFLQGLRPLSGPVKITQVFRKHPVYRLWYQWFLSLHQFKNITFDIEQKLGLKDTYLLYEMWCFIQIIRTLRELGQLNDTAELFTKRDGYYFLRLAENKESVIKLNNGGKLIYQKIIQFNTNPYYSYTQRMIPDIVIDYHGQLFVMDPKYRIPANIPMALGEMHKYRDGILARDGDMTVVKEVYILTPIECYMTSDKNFYDVGYHERYRMGAYSFSPGETNELFKEWLEKIF